MLSRNMVDVMEFAAIFSFGQQATPFERDRILMSQDGCWADNPKKLLRRACVLHSWLIRSQLETWIPYPDRCWVKLVQPVLGTCCLFAWRFIGRYLIPEIEINGNQVTPNSSSVDIHYYWEGGSCWSRRDFWFMPCHSGLRPTWIVIVCRIAW